MSQRRWGQVKHGGKKQTRKASEELEGGFFFWQVDNLDSLDVCDVCKKLHLACGVCHITRPNLHLLPLSPVSLGTELHWQIDLCRHALSHPAQTRTNDSQHSDCREGKKKLMRRRMSSGSHLLVQPFMHSGSGGYEMQSTYWGGCWGCFLICLICHLTSTSLMSCCESWIYWCVMEWKGYNCEHFRCEFIDMLTYAEKQPLHAFTLPCVTVGK